MFLITVKNLNIILVVNLVKKLLINNVAYTSKGSGVYVLCGWRICPMGVAYTSYGGGVYVQWTYTSKGPNKQHRRIHNCDLRLKLYITLITFIHD